MNAKTFKAMSTVFNMPIQVSVGGGFLEDNDYKMLENLHVVANCVNQHDSLVSKLDILASNFSVLEIGKEKLQRENDELKATVNALLKTGDAMAVNLGYSDDTFAQGYQAAWIATKSQSLTKCLLDHNKQVIETHINAFAQQIFDAQLRVKQTIKVFPMSMATEYIKQLGGKK